MNFDPPAVDSPSRVFRLELAESGRPNGRPRGHQRRRPVWASFGWALLLAVCAGLTNRYFAIQKPWAILAAGLVPLLLLPLLVTSVAAFLGRSRTLRVATAAVLLAYLIVVSPFDAVVGCYPRSSSDQIRVLSHNVLSHGAEASEVEKLLNKTDPDVFVMAEASGLLLSELGPDVAAAYPFQTDELGPNRGIVVYSRWPIENATYQPVDGLNSYSVEVVSPFGSFTVFAVHTSAPDSNYFAQRWQQQFQTMRRVPTDSAALIAGDFNATEDHRPFRQLLSEGWSDVHDNRGCGPDNTWPTTLPYKNDRYLVPVMRLDHILTSRHFETLSVNTHRVPGSDHAAVEAHVRLAPSS